MKTVGEDSDPDDVQATEPIRFGVLGTGRIAGKLAAAMARTPAVRAVAVGSRDANRASSFASLHDVPLSTGSYEDVLADPAVDAVYLALPPHVHLEWGRAAAAAGKAVLCEKPLTQNAADAAALAKACAAAKNGAGVALIDGTQWTRTPRAIAFRDALNSEAIGSLRRVTAAFSFHAEGWGDTEHRLDPHRGGGVLLDLGWYCVHAALWAFDDDPVRVACHLAHETNDSGDPVDVAASCTLTFPGDRTAGFDVSYGTAWRNWIEFAGEAGSLVCDDFTNPRDPEKVRHFYHDQRGDAERIELPPFDPQVEFLTKAAAAIRAGGDEDGVKLALRTQTVLDRLREAAG
ncbi:Gfo/Idh/MocA family protein [Alienimonas chondri]|uniref:Scyllo-inositol 2-dehydrogenase (NADP(+)) IolU n=1 Tax=Alienimonas chondri TaxID=2681879 RepID=A0ABX1V886_9PLAN|nr:Gfo/Idh/MocA family oxidoreductase [Alienimonas chondri]NNJ24359.1 scyllo-inositol 2-dehydrogenase (NADP(+)) IolU [Alienimonas chondri]